MQQIANAALEQGLALYEQRHPSAQGNIQVFIVVLRNRDASILAETGGRRFTKTVPPHTAILTASRNPCANPVRQ